MESLPLFKTNKERRVFFLFIIGIFLFTLYLEFSTYKKIIKNEVYQTKGTILNIYPKSSHQVIKVKTEDFTFFTTIENNLQINIYQELDLTILTQNITFISYLKGFYTSNFNLHLHKIKNTPKQNIYNYIDSQHTSQDVSSLYSALFLASALTQDTRELAAQYGVSHLIAISGFHLSIISFVLYFILHSLYHQVHARLFPYRNKRLDLLLIVAILLYVYLIFIDIPPSLLRAFVMFLFSLFLLRMNIKLISFETLFIILVVIIALFPKLLFSLSLWFSIAGVFYIFLFLKYFQKLHKIVQLLLFNFWIYLAINPITHYFFGATALEQLYSPLVTIAFSIFYPISAVLHLLHLGELFDSFIHTIINTQIKSTEVFTPLYFFIFYIVISLLAIISKKIFIILNFLLVGYSFWLYFLKF